MPKALPWFVLAAVILLADRLTKAAVLQVFAPGERLEVSGYFNLVLVINQGAAFSFLADAGGWQMWFLAAVALVAAVVISGLLVRRESERPQQQRDTTLRHACHPRPPACR